MRAVLDTNVLISAVISPGVCHKVLLKGFHKVYHLLISTDILREFENTLLRYPEKFHMKQGEVTEESETIKSHGVMITPKKNVNVIKRDLSDNMLLEVAETGNADYIVSGDLHLRELTSYKGIPILNPRQFLRRIKQLTKKGD